LKNSQRSQRAWRWGAALFLLLLPVLPVHARTRHSDAWARSQFARAERMREALNGRPSQERTRHQYQQAIDAYRRVYYGAPTSSKADPSVVAVAELMVEMGRRFDDAKILRSAIGQYQFLRREYPGSKYRVDALFTIGEVYKDDLNDTAKAQATFRDFLKRYPRSHLADDARAALEEPVQRASLKTRSGGNVDRNKAAPKIAADDDKVADTGSDKSSSANDAQDDDSKSPALARVTGIRHWSTPDYTRVAIDVEHDVKYESQRISHPDRIFFDLLETKLASTLVGKTFDVDDGFLRKIRVAQFQPGKTRVVLEVDELSDYEVFLLPNPSRLIIDIHGKDTHGKRTAKGSDDQSETATAAEPKFETTKPSPTTLVVKSDEEKKQEKIEDAKIEEAKKASAKETKEQAANSAPKKRIVEVDDDDDNSTVAKLDPPDVKTPPIPAPKSTRRRKSSGKAAKTVAPDVDVREAQPTANGDRSLIRALGLKIGKIVIDPGHGGHDTGTIGPNGLLEKDLVLDVAKRLGKQLERLGAEVVYTRSDDTFIPLETRTAIANQAQADLFISIHANSSRDPDARGVETYYLNFTSSRDALEVAARENAVSEKSIHELQDLVKKIALKEKIEESQEFASDVQQALYTGLSVRNASIRDRGVKKAPFIVLIGANMPSILAEISFVSNPVDARKLETPQYRQRIADSLYRGIEKYVNGLSGVKVASKVDKTSDQ
jgi:N-acetylmuramoyl-L-alanine amidase